MGGEERLKPVVKYGAGRRPKRCYAKSFAQQSARWQKSATCELVCLSKVLKDRGIIWRNNYIDLMIQFRIWFGELVVRYFFLFGGILIFFFTLFFSFFVLLIFISYKIASNITDKRLPATSMKAAICTNIVIFSRRAT